MIGRLYHQNNLDCDISRYSFFLFFAPKPKDVYRCHVYRVNIWGNTLSNYCDWLWVAGLAIFFSRRNLFQPEEVKRTDGVLISLTQFVIDYITLDTSANVARVWQVIIVYRHCTASQLRINLMNTKRMKRAQDTRRKKEKKTVETNSELPNDRKSFVCARAIQLN